MNSVPSISEPVEFDLTGATPKVALQLPSDMSGYRISSDRDPLQVCAHTLIHVSIIPEMDCFYLDHQEEGGLCSHKLQAT